MNAAIHSNLQTTVTRLFCQFCNVSTGFATRDGTSGSLTYSCRNQGAMSALDEVRFKSLTTNQFLISLNFCHCVEIGVCSASSTAIPCTKFRPHLLNAWSTRTSVFLVFFFIHFCGINYRWGFSTYDLGTFKKIAYSLF